ncbi:MAG: class II fructose-bisphosphate aldolase [Patescibacteria group bacterium]|nr:class II fructose-bisphosphate aldolase [Patescibacteria group bacterium]MBU1952887.1 class II fructose-bisphosphate aldolase [Patescibacteria group bacterium]
MNALKYLEKARKEKFAIGAFNCANIETLKAITNAAKNLHSPILIECSPGEIEHIGVSQMVSLARTFEKQLHIPIILNLDHGTDPEKIKQAIDSGFDYVHFDGGKLPFEEAVKVGKELADYAHKNGVVIEGEIDSIEGSSADHTGEKPSVDQNLYTDPDKAKAFIEKTGIDVFASFVGNLHGIYSENKHLNLDLLKQIHKENPNTFLSLHGGSGIIEDDIKEAIKCGVVKINVNSELRITFKMTLEEELKNTKEIAAYKYMQKPIKEMQKVVEYKIKIFGSQNKI